MRTEGYSGGTDSSGKLLVPDNFKELFEGDTLYYEGNEVTSEMLVHTIDSDLSGHYKTMSLDIKILGHKDCRVASKISTGDVSKYLDSSVGRVVTDINVYGTNDVSIVSVPYRIKSHDTEQNTYNVLIYDNLKKEDTVSIYKNKDITIDRFSYYRDGTSIFVEFGTTKLVRVDDIKSSLGIRLLKQNTLVSIPSECIHHDSYANTDTDSIKFTINIGELEVPDFLFMFVNLDSDDRVVLPIYTKLDKSKNERLIVENADFSTIDYNTLVGAEVSKTASAEATSKDKYIMATGSEDSLEIKKSEELPFL